MELLLLTDIVIIFGLAVTVLLIFHYLSLPSIVGLLLTGILAGPHSFGLVGAVHEVEMLAEIGVILLLFSIGIEFSFKKLIEIKKQVVVGGSLQVGLTIVAVFLISNLFGLSTADAVFIGFLIALSSTAIVLRLIQERAEVDTPHGKTGLGILLFQDVIIVPMILITPLLAGIKPNTIDSEVLTVFAKGISIVILILVASRWLMPWLLHQVVRTRSKELFLLSIVAICFAIAWLTASAGLSLALGAFIAGLIISESEYSHQALGNILPFRNVFTSFFFVSIGMLLDTSYLFNNLPIILVAAGGTLILKAVIASFAVMLMGMPLRCGILTGLSICQVGEFSFILSRTGVNHGLIANYYQLFLAVAVLTMAATPFIIAFAPRFADNFLQAPLPQKLKTGLWPLPEDNNLTKLEKHLTIIGFGLNGRNVAYAAKMSGIPYKIIELSSDIVRSEREKGEPIFYGDAIHKEVLQHADIEDARVVVVAINDPTATREIVETIRNLTEKAHLIVRTRYLTEMKPLYDLGANEVIPEEFETSVEIFSRVLANYLVPRDEIDKLAIHLRSDGYEMFRMLPGKSSLLSKIDLHLPDVEVAAIRIEENSPVVGNTLLNLELRKKHGVTVLAVRHDSQTFSNPEVDAPFCVDDILYVVGTPEKLADIRPLFKQDEKSDNTVS
ncbi:cation:proton antiporter [Desulfosediminicola flagellatus]|uniref:cation:proton antiporter domain-containing protein n=1 Tax=Desulfosediminicola flagellatus TaxID=2569541 RepID=UPI0010AD42AE|nr:cation:proton antiporter [Desulfosediminicola flagellatus]